MSITKKMQTRRYREQTSGYQLGERGGRGNIKRGLKGSNLYISKLQGYIVQHRVYSQYFIMTINRILPLKIVNHCIVHLCLI